MSGLLLSAPSAQGSLAAQPDPVAGKLLSGSATGRRAFTSSDVLSLYAEIYENASGGPPRRVDVATTLINEAGREVSVARDVLTRGPSDDERKVSDVRALEAAAAEGPPSRPLSATGRRSASRRNGRGERRHKRDPFQRSRPVVPVAKPLSSRGESALN